LAPKAAAARICISRALSLLKIRSGLQLLHLRDSVVSLQTYELSAGFIDFNPPRQLSVFAGPPVEPEAIESLESQARYIARPPMAMDALQKGRDRTLELDTPPDPRTGATVLVLDPLEWIDRSTHIPDPGRHARRSYGAYGNRSRVTPELRLRVLTMPPKAALPPRTRSLPPKHGAPGRAY
jgi:hypothetical protein